MSLGKDMATVARVGMERPNHHKYRTDLVKSATRRLLEAAEGEAANRGGLVETPDRVAKAWDTWTEGYDMDPESVLKVFKDGGERYDEMIMIKNIPFYSHCEHHLAPFFGHVHLAYIPSTERQHIIGLSKASRLVNVFARRLQVQERLTVQIADAMQEHVKPIGVGVVITARHLCMESRGISQQGMTTTTSAMRGAMRDNHETRAEFIALAR